MDEVLTQAQKPRPRYSPLPRIRGVRPPVSTAAWVHTYELLRGEKIYWGQLKYRRPEIASRMRYVSAERRPIGEALLGAVGWGRAVVNKLLHAGGLEPMVLVRLRRMLLCTPSLLKLYGTPRFTCRQVMCCLHCRYALFQQIHRHFTKWPWPRPSDGGWVVAWWLSSGVHDPAVLRKLIRRAKSYRRRIGMRHGVRVLLPISAEAVQGHPPTQTVVLVSAGWIDDRTAFHQTRHGSQRARLCLTAQALLDEVYGLLCYPVVLMQNPDAVNGLFQAFGGARRIRLVSYEKQATREGSRT